MQPIAWYLRRLSSMSAREIGWRCRGAARDVWDAGRTTCGFVPSGSTHRSPPGSIESLIELAPESVQATSEVFRRYSDWLVGLVHKADRILDHRLSYFDLEDVDLGDPIDWHLDRASGKRPGLGLIQFLDYRDFDRVGDCKLVWEPNRHHQFVVLARAYRTTGDARYADGILAQLESWLDANPFGRGMNWRSPLELGIRLINWVWALGLIRNHAADEATSDRVLRSMYDHAWEIRRKYSRGSSANNHLIGEAAGVFVFACAAARIFDVTAWRDEAARILEEEILNQTFADGCTREHAFGYHCFVAQFFLICMLTGERTGYRFSDMYRERLIRMIEFALSLMAASGTLPKLGDADDGYVLDLGDPIDDADSWAAILAHLTDSGSTAYPLSRIPETLFWIGGARALETLEVSGDPAVPRTGADMSSRAFTDSGYYLLQSPQFGISVLADCAELGYDSIAAHGHADALSFVLRAFGTDILVDAGTFDYFTYPDWRTYFRSTAAHNTVRIDGRDQSEMLGPFLWGRRANVSVLEWSPSKSGALLKARHDGYGSLASPVYHTRTILLEPPRLRIIDELDGSGMHDVDLLFHFAPECHVDLTGNGSASIRVRENALHLDLDSHLTAAVMTADGERPAGWFSPGYHRKVATTTLIASGRAELPARFETTFRFAEKA